MFSATPAGSQVALVAARRMIAEAAAALTPPAPIAILAALADDAHAQALSESLTARFAGRVLPATVMQRLDSGHGIVDILGEHIKVAARLPAAGAAVMLRFAVAPGAGAANPAPAAQVSLGSLAQVLSEFAQARAEPLDLGAVAAAVTAPRQFAASLAEMVRDSGVFYESHLERWSRGQYPLENIRREPQALQAPAAADSRPRMAAIETTPTSTPAPPLAESTQPIVREQLDLIERKSLEVAILAWPGQAARLTITDQRDEESAARRARTEPAWSTRLALELPRLGRLEADLSLAGDRLGLVLRVAPDSATRLASGAHDLALALEAAGIRLARLKIVDQADE